MLNKVSLYNPHCDKELISKAYNLAFESHKEQKRVSGEPYFIHPYKVTLLLADYHADDYTLCASLLHDVIEDTSVTYELIEKNFNTKIAQIVDGVTKLDKILFKSKIDRQASSLRKMLLAMVQDARVILVKLADRLHNMTTLNHMSDEKKAKIAKETLDIYAPLAHRLGIYKIKVELEDLAFKYINPKAYQSLKKMIDSKKNERDHFILNMKKIIEDELKKNKIEAEVSGRSKHFYSIYQKMQEQGKKLYEIFDLVALRIITSSVQDCYAALGIIHNLYRPIPGRIKDYIAVPKSNLYKSLHTTVITNKGVPLEIQIRTLKMHQIAEEGIAAHWSYKAKTEKFDLDEFAKISWIKQILDVSNSEMISSKEFLEDIKFNLYEDEVFVFTPAGEVKTLIAGATALDFAFNVHTEVGFHCVGAKANGKIVPLNYILMNGDIIEILTLKTAFPKRNWLLYVKTAKAKAKIKSHFKQQEKDEKVIEGKKIFETEFEKIIAEFLNVDEDLNKEDFLLNNFLKSRLFSDYLEKTSISTIENFYYSIATNEITSRSVLNKIFPDLNRKLLETKKFEEIQKSSEKNNKKVVAGGILVDGQEDTLVKLSKCCNPIPGDEIIGFISRGKGVTIHTKSCSNVKNLIQDKKPEVNVEWIKKNVLKFNAQIIIKAFDRKDLLHSITNILSNMRVNISSFSATALENQMAIFKFKIEVKDNEELKDIMKNLKKIDGVINIYRSTSI